MNAAFHLMVFHQLSWSLFLSWICSLGVLALVCVTFSLPPGVGGWLRLLLVALPELFCLPLYSYAYWDPYSNELFHLFFPFQTVLFCTIGKQCQQCKTTEHRTNMSHCKGMLRNGEFLTVNFRIYWFRYLTLANQMSGYNPKCIRIENFSAQMTFFNAIIYILTSNIGAEAAYFLQDHYIKILWKNCFATDGTIKEGLDSAGVKTSLATADMLGSVTGVGMWHGSGHPSKVDVASGTPVSSTT